MMNTRIQTIILIVFVLGSITFARFDRFAHSSDTKISSAVSIDRDASVLPASPLQFQHASLLLPHKKVRRVPIRAWDVLDPAPRARAVLLQSLDDSFPLLKIKSEFPWPMASLTKLLTAVVVSENIGLNKKIFVSETALTTEGISGGLRAREEYAAQDLIKIMLLTSSNDAAVAFEEYVGGKEKFINMMREKIRMIGMRGTIVYDASGLATENQSTASDLLLLVQYITLYHPDIFALTRLPQFLVQPTNDVVARTIVNINPFVMQNNFLGGKTGTSPDAGENLIAIFSFATQRIAVIILGSDNRVSVVDTLLEWVRRAYTFS